MTDKKSEIPKNKTMKEYRAEHKKRKKWVYITESVASVVVFITVYMLILPAITMEKKPNCGMEEHIHTASCYELVDIKRASGSDADYAEQYTTGEEIVSIWASDTETADSVETTDGNVLEAAYETDTADSLETIDETASETDELSEGIYEYVLICDKEEHVHDDYCYEENEATIAGTQATELAETTAKPNTTIDGNTTTTTTANPDDATIAETTTAGANEAGTPDDTTIDGNTTTTTTANPDNATIAETTTAGTNEAGTPDDTTIDGNTTTTTTAKTDSTESTDVTENEADADTTVQSLINYIAGDTGDTDAGTKLILSDTGNKDSVEKIELYYMCPDDSNITDWTLVTDEVALHGDDSMKLDVKYKNVVIDELKASNYKLYYKLPDWIEKIETDQSAQMYDKNLELQGTVTIEDDYLVTTFEKAWIDKQNGISINGTMGVEVTMNADHITSDTIKIGTYDFKVDYVYGEWQSKYGTISLEKSEAKYIEMDDDADLLQYTLTVTAGGTDMPDVKVEDYFQDIMGNSNKYKDVMVKDNPIVGVTGTEQTIISNETGPETSTVSGFTPGTLSYDNDTGKLVWNIGDMKEGETRTLTYQVKLRSDMTGRNNTNAVIFENTADLYSKSEKRDTETTTFNMQASINMQKGNISYKADEDNVGGVVTYYIYLKSQDYNTYTMDNIKIYDFFRKNNSVNSVNSPYDVEVDSSSFHLYKGCINSEAKLASAEELTLADDAISIETDTDGKFKSFTCYVGDFGIKEEKTLVYSVRIRDSYYLDNNGSFTITNRSVAYEDDTKNTAIPNPNSEYQIQAFETNSNIVYGNWEKKYNGVKQTQTETITMSGDIYQEKTTTDDKGYSITKETGVSSFDVGYGYYKYQVVLNQGGKVDISHVDLKDTLEGYMKYKGFLRIDAYESLFSDSLLSDTPQEITQEIKKTVWLDIDGLSSYQFELYELGFTGAQSYVLTYYTAVADYTGSDLYVTTKNSFTMTGEGIGEGGKKYKFGGMKVGVSISTSTSSSFDAQKYSWYFRKTTYTSDWGYGKLYWYIKVSGTDIPAGIYFKDTVANIYHKLVGTESFVGVYAVDSDSSPASVEALSESLDSGGLVGEEISSDDYEVSEDNGSLVVHFKNQVTIPEGREIYIVIKTAATGVSYSKVTYKNALYQSRDGQTYQKVGENVDQTVSSYYSSSKSLANNRPFVYDGNSYYYLDGTQETNGRWGNYKVYGSNKQRITEPGTYIEYKLEVCKNGLIDGDAVFSDTLPEGLELVFLRNQWYHGTNPLPYAESVIIEELEDDPAWTKYEEASKNGNTMATSDKLIYYYNKETREIRWKFSNIQVTNGGIIDLQLVTKVVDEDVLLGLKKGEYVNSLITYKEGEELEKVSAGKVTVDKTPLSKTIDGAIDGTTIPFKIVVNSFGEDLLEYTDRITFVDELDTNLRLNVDSIKILDKNNNDVTKSDDIDMELCYEDGKTILKVTMPDDKKYTITYNARVNAENGETVTINNVAHWEGEQKVTNSEVNQSVKINLSGSASASGNASVKLTKYDANNITKKLKGATFEMQEVTYDKDTGTFTEEGAAHVSTTDENGVAYFSTSGEDWMEYDTIYRITETTAPVGYDLSEPRYIMITWRSYAEGEIPDIVEVEKSVIELEFAALDEETSKPFELPQTGGPGIYMYTLWGAAFMTVSAVGYGVIRRRRRVMK